MTPKRVKTTLVRSKNNHIFGVILTLDWELKELFSSRSFIFQPNLISDGRNMSIWQGSYLLWTWTDQPAHFFESSEQNGKHGKRFCYLQKCFPFTEKRPQKPKDWYQSCLWRNGTRISIWNVPNVDNRTTCIEDLYYSWKFSVASNQKVVFNFIFQETFLETCRQQEFHWGGCLHHSLHQIRFNWIS